MPSSVREMLAEANASVPRLNPAEVRDMIGKRNVLIVDVRNAPELAAGGTLKGAANAPRGMLEFLADPKSLYQNPAFQKDKTVLIHCGPSGRAALSGKSYQSVDNAGGFKELADAGLDTEPAWPRSRRRLAPTRPSPGERGKLREGQPRVSCQRRRSPRSRS